jgi:NADPH:quinone reductase-like Zn-dependent oxidoreductase
MVCAGTIVAVGSGVKSLRPGDAVIGAAFGRPMDYRRPPGFCAEYCVGREPLFVKKPPNVSFEDTVGMFGVTLTAYQSAELARRVYREERQRLRKEGKIKKQNDGDEDEDLFKDRDMTVFVPAALSSTGFPAVQLFKNYYGAKRIVSTVSTPKMPLVEQYLPGVVDTLIDYTTTPDMTAAVGAGTIDFAYNTQFTTLSSIPPLMKRGAADARGPITSVVVSIASMFPSALLREALGVDQGHVHIPFFLFWLFDVLVWYDRNWLFGRARKEGVVLDVLSGHFGVREDLERTVEIIGSGKIRCVKTVVDLEDIDALRAAADKVAKGKGGVGSLVVKII